MVLKIIFRTLFQKKKKHLKISFKDPMDYFLLDSKTGELRTARPLDKEALPDATGLVVLTVRVSPWPLGQSLPQIIRQFHNQCLIQIGTRAH